MKFLNPTSGFPAGDLTKRLGFPEKMTLKTARYNYRTSTGLGETETPVLESTSKILHTPSPGGKQQRPDRTLNHNYLLMLDGLQ